MMRRTLPVLLTTLLIAGCGDSTGPDDADRRLEGSLSLSYEEMWAGSGGASGSLSASSSLDPDRNPYVTDEPVAFAIRFHDPATGDSTLAIYASVPGSDGRQDRVLVSFDQGDVRQPGTFTLYFYDCDPSLDDPATDCAHVDVHLNDEGDHTQAAPDELYILLEEGELVVDAVDDERIRGSFHGMGTDMFWTRMFEVGNGSFDLPILREDNASPTVRMLLQQMSRRP